MSWTWKGKRKGKGNPMYGKHFSEESKDKLRKQKIGKKILLINMV